ncbi:MULTISPECIES: hypothetical protein [unclassified Thalassospira]|uniref:hypothetical protein n=1 Tax=unclassified Thalassospira TaxID=2648997 RepID=UPI0007A5BE0E|nr:MULTISPECIES: hypothetical protein [unclassified Thalassospira]KZC99718.1 hypothetical protein AUQ41_08560 [Thalassospira sp. MCCC 1A02898]ONH85352.1 hypothetical protein TH47_05775 [Thalassospira sp. MCCC 1A02803]
MSKAQSELAELISAARDFMIHVYAQAPKTALQGRTAESLFMELHDLSPEQAILQVKAVPEGAPSVRLAQAIKAASVADDGSQAEIDRLRSALEVSHRALCNADRYIKRTQAGLYNPMRDAAIKAADEALKGGKS